MPVIYCRECKVTFLSADDPRRACRHIRDALRKIRIETESVAKPGDNAANRLRPDRQGSGATIPAGAPPGRRKP